MAKITFTKHAASQLRERGITPAEIYIALASPDRTIAQTDKRFQAVKRTNQRYALVIVYDKNNGQISIITAFRTSKLNKYL